MTLNFFQELYKNLLEDGFEKLNRPYKNENINNNTKYTYLGKMKNDIFYILFIFNMENLSIEELKLTNNNCMKFLENMKKDNNLNHIIVINLMITEEENKIKDFINIQKPFEEASLNNIYWAVNIKKGDILVNKNNPTKILNLVDIIHKTYKKVKSNNIKYICEKNTEDIKKVVEEKNTIFNKNIPILTCSIILINFIIFIFMKLNGGVKDIYNLLYYGALIPEYIIYNKEYSRLITYIFLHSSMKHFLYNSFNLYIFGTRVEKYYGRKNFIIIYLLSGIVSGVFSMIFTNSIAIGSSGAIFGIMGSLAVMANIFKKNLDGLEYLDILLFIVLSIGICINNKDIDNFGHLGGLISGIIISFIICKKIIKKEENKK